MTCCGGGGGCCGWNNGWGRGGCCGAGGWGNGGGRGGCCGGWAGANRFPVEQVAVVPDRRISKKERRRERRHEKKLRRREARVIVPVSPVVAAPAVGFGGTCNYFGPGFGLGMGGCCC